MKIQDIIFTVIFLLMLVKWNRSITLFAGLLCLALSIPLFFLHVFFTAERLTWYAATFIFLSLLQYWAWKDWLKSIFSILKRSDLINLFLVGIILLNIGQTLFANKEKYLSFNYWQRFDYLKYEYENSQYKVQNPKGWIPDEMLYAYTGGASIKGTSPILVAPEVAPLGKYLIGISALITGNENIVILISALIALLLMYKIGLQIYSNKTLALIPLVLISFEPIFKNQLTYVPLLDIIQFPFLLASFYFFNTGLKTTDRKRLLFFVFGNLALGGFISTKFFITGFIVVISWFLTLFFQKDKKSLIPLTVSLPFSLFVLIGSYFRVFLDGYTLRQFFGIQKWIFLYHQSKLIMPFTIWPLIYFNKWYVWYGDKPIISDGQWTIMWPIIQTISLLTIILYVLNKIQRRREIEIVMIWSILYILFVSFGNASSRYLVIYIPVLYIISLYGLIEIVKILLKKLKTSGNYDTIKA